MWPCPAMQLQGGGGSGVSAPGLSGQRFEGAAAGGPMASSKAGMRTRGSPRHSWEHVSLVAITGPQHAMRGVTPRVGALVSALNLRFHASPGADGAALCQRGRGARRSEEAAGETSPPWVGASRPTRFGAAPTRFGKARSPQSAHLLHVLAGFGAVRRYSVRSTGLPAAAKAV